MFISSLRALAFSFMTRVVVEAMLAGLLKVCLASCPDVSWFCSCFLKTMLSGLVFENEVEPTSCCLIDLILYSSAAATTGLGLSYLLRLLPWKLIDSRLFPSCLALFKFYLPWPPLIEVCCCSSNKSWFLLNTFPLLLKEDGFEYNLLPDSTSLELG